MSPDLLSVKFGGLKYFNAGAYPIDFLGIHRMHRVVALIYGTALPLTVSWLLTTHGSGTYIWNGALCSFTLLEPNFKPSTLLVILYLETN